MSIFQMVHCCRLEGAYLRMMLSISPGSTPFSFKMSGTSFSTRMLKLLGTRSFILGENPVSLSFGTPRSKRALRPSLLSTRNDHVVTSGSVSKPGTGG